MEEGSRGAQEGKERPAEVNVLAEAQSVNELQRRLEKSEQDKRALLDHVMGLVSRNAELVMENNEVKSKGIQPATIQVEGNVALQSREETENSNTMVPYEDYHDLTEKFNDLRKYSGDYNRLEEKYRRLQHQYSETNKALDRVKRRNHLLEQKYNQMKDTVKEWDRYARNHKAKRLARGSEEPTSTATSIIGTSPALPPITPKSELANATTSEQNRSPPLEEAGLITPMRDRADELVPERGNEPIPSDDLPLLDEGGDLPLPHHDFHDTPNNTGIRLLDSGINLSSAREKASASSRIPSSATTEDEFPELPTVRDPEEKGAGDEDNDAPVVVSARSLKRKRQHSAHFPVYDERGRAAGTPEAPIRVKEEDFSSPPRLSTFPRSLLRKETLDLDDLGPHIIATPKKSHDPYHYRRAGNLQKTARIATLQHERSNSVPPTWINEPAGDSQMGNHLQDAAPIEISSDPPNIKLEARAASEPTHAEDLSHILQPLDANALPTAEDAEEPASKRLRQESDREQWKFAAMTESGEQLPPRRKDSETGLFGTRMSPNAARANWNHRLQGPNNTPSATKRTPGTTKARPNPLPTPPTTVNKPSNLRKVLEQPKTTPSRPPRAPNSRPGSRHGPQTESRPKSSGGKAPLRSYPLSKLTLEDFKPNPAFNRGYSYAFSEVVRNRDARACLPGCTNPACCGSNFRAMASNLPPLDSSQEESMLEDFLGDAFDTQRTKRMRKDEWDELVLQARTRDLAKKAGKHKHAYQRQATPPGFWRADFPTTQEEAEDRKQAEEMTGKKVQERWMEAMRRGGQWIFRDE